MKKVLTLFAAVLLLAGCTKTTTYQSQITDKDTIIASVGNASISKQDLYEHLMDESGVEYVLNNALTHIAANFTLNEDEVNKRVSETETSWKAFLGDRLDSYTEQAFGYKTFEEYKQKVLIPSVRQILMIEQYAIDNYDTLASKYMFVKARQIIVNDQATGMSVIAALSSNEMTFEEALNTYSTDSTNKTNKGEMGLLSDLSSCTADEYIISILPQFTVPAVYSVPIELSTGKFAVLEIIETDKTELKDEILVQLKQAEEVIYEAESYYLSQNNFTILDEFFKEQMKAQYPEYVK